MSSNTAWTSIPQEPLKIEWVTDPQHLLRSLSVGSTQGGGPGSFTSSPTEVGDGSLSPPSPGITTKCVERPVGQTLLSSSRRNTATTLSTKSSFEDLEEHSELWSCERFGMTLPLQPGNGSAGAAAAAASPEHQETFEPPLVLSGPPGLTAMTTKVNASPSYSEGAILHGSGQCRPCAWFYKPSGCGNGAACRHCHLCPEGEIKARRKAKVRNMWLGQSSDTVQSAWPQGQSGDECQVSLEAVAEAANLYLSAQQLGAVAAASAVPAVPAPAAASFTAAAASAATPAPPVVSSPLSLTSLAFSPLTLPRTVAQPGAVQDPSLYTANFYKSSEVKHESEADLPFSFPLVKDGRAVFEEGTFAPAPPRQDVGVVPSLGSLLHGTGSCKPCAWFHKASGCTNGAECQHCHMCPKDEIKERRKLKKKSSDLPPQSLSSGVLSAEFDNQYGGQRFQDDAMSAVLQAYATAMTNTSKVGSTSSSTVATPNGSSPPKSLMTLSDADVSPKFLTPDVSGALPSRGSALHLVGTCKPCAWFWKPNGCRNGQECSHCHLCPSGALKERKRTKELALRMGLVQPRNSAAALSSLEVIA